MGFTRFVFVFFISLILGRVRVLQIPFWQLKLSPFQYCFVLFLFWNSKLSPFQYCILIFLFWNSGGVKRKGTNECTLVISKDNSNDDETEVEYLLEGTKDFFFFFKSPCV